MKRLYLIRHAKSSWDHPDLDDFDRPLNERGIHDAHAMAKWLKQWFKKHKITQELLITSPANRAISTAQIFAQELTIKQDKIIIEEKIYENSVKTLLDIIEQIADDYSEVLFVGHNPSLSNFINNYLFDNHPIHNMPTTGVCCISADTKQWQRFIEAENKLVFFESPELLDAENAEHKKD